MRSSALVSFTALVFVAASARADDVPAEPALGPEIEELTKDYRASRPFGALAVGVIHNGRRESWAFGEIGAGDARVPADGRTLFEIGSCTKIFTSLSLAVAVTRGDVKLDDPIGKLLPDAGLSPDASAITLQQLSTHTSGLSRIPLGMFVDAIVKRNNPYRDFTPERMLDILHSWKRPGKVFHSYSNFGAGLLGYVLTRHEHAADYDSLIRSTVTGPLRMSDTVATLSDDQKARMASGFDVKGNPADNWDFNALAGAGALRSTTDDLLTFLDSQIHPETSPLKDAIELSQQQHYAGKPLPMGLGWMILERDGRRILLHDGGTGAYCSFFAFDRANNMAVVLLSNTGDAYAGDPGIGRMGITLVKRLGPKPPAPEPKPEKAPQ